jgi:hypothetical protein
MVWLAWLTGRLRWPLPRVAPVRVFVGLLAAWLVVKVGFVHAWVPIRDGNANGVLRAFGMPGKAARDPHVKGEQIAALVPADQPLYLFRLKDEGVMFYYARCHPDGAADRVVRRLHRTEDLPSTAELVYCILSEDEWLAWDRRRPAEVLSRLTDQQDAPIVLIAVRGTSE